MNLRVRRVLTVLVGVVVAGVMLVLGVWQMASFQRSVVDIAEERASEAPVALISNIRADGTIEDIYGRRVELSGQVVPGEQLLVGSQWPLRVVVPFEMTDGQIVPLVLGTTDTPPEITAPGPLDVSGIFTAGDSVGELTAPSDAPSGSMSSLRLQELVQQWPQPMIAGYVTLDAGGAATFGLTPAIVELPEAQGTSMHQGYALQWWVFAAASIAFSIVIARGLKPAGERQV
ncbi:MAG: SURF1 family protein [Arachnia sp.]